MKTMTISFNKGNEMLFESRHCKPMELLFGYNKVVEEMTHEHPEMDSLLFDKDMSINLNTYEHSKLVQTSIIKVA